MGFSFAILAALCIFMGDLEKLNSCATSQSLYEYFDIRLLLQTYKNFSNIPREEINRLLGQMLDITR